MTEIYIRNLELFLSAKVKGRTFITYIPSHDELNIRLTNHRITYTENITNISTIINQGFTSLDLSRQVIKRYEKFITSLFIIEERKRR